MKMINEEHALLKLPKMKTKPLALSATLTYFDVPEVLKGGAEDEDDIEFDDKYAIDVNDENTLVAKEITIEELLDHKEWYGGRTQTFNNGASKWKETALPYIDPDLEDGLVETGRTDEYIFWTNPTEFPQHDVELANDEIGNSSMSTDEVKKSWNNLVLDTALRIMRLKTFTAATHYERLKHALAWIQIRQMQVRGMMELFAKNGINVDVPFQMIQPLEYDEEWQYLGIINKALPGGRLFKESNTMYLCWKMEGGRGLQCYGYSKDWVEKFVDSIEKEALKV